MTASDVLKEFEELGRRSSFHLADDTSSGEWRTGYNLQLRAMEMFRQYPELQPEMRRIAEKEFIWRIYD